MKTISFSESSFASLAELVKRNIVPDNKTFCRFTELRTSEQQILPSLYFTNNEFFNCYGHTNQLGIALHLWSTTDEILFVYEILGSIFTSHHDAAKSQYNIFFRIKREKVRGFSTEPNYKYQSILSKTSYEMYKNLGSSGVMGGLIGAVHRGIVELAAKNEADYIEEIGEAFNLYFEDESGKKNQLN